MIRKYLFVYSNVLQCCNIFNFITLSKRSDVGAQPPIEASHKVLCNPKYDGTLDLTILHSPSPLRKAYYFKVKKFKL